MLATAGERPYEDANWLHEVKWDGYRVQAVVRDGKVKLWTRNRADGKTYFPELTGPPTWIDADEAVVDGEVVAFDEDGRPSFSALQERTGLMGLESRTGRRRPRAEREPAEPPEPRSAAPIIYQAFDLLYLDGRSLLDVPLESRKRLLHRILRPHPLVQYATHVVGEGPAFLDAALAGGLEGVVAKKRTSRYRPGERSPDWVKIKVRAEQEVAVIGWLPRQGSTDDLGSLIVAVHGPDGLVHAGQVGSGLDGRTRRELLAAFAKIGPPRARRCRARRPCRARAGWSPGSWPAWSSRSGRPTACFGSRRSSASSSTATCPRPSARTRRAARRRGPEAATPSAPPGPVVAVTADGAGCPGRPGQGGSMGDRWPGRQAHEPGQGPVPRHRQPIPRRSPSATWPATT